MTYSSSPPNLSDRRLEAWVSKNDITRERDYPATLEMHAVFHAMLTTPQKWRRNRRRRLDAFTAFRLMPGKLDQDGYRDDRVGSDPNWIHIYHTLQIFLHRHVKSCMKYSLFALKDTCGLWHLNISISRYNHKLIWWEIREQGEYFPARFHAYVHIKFKVDKRAVIHQSLGEKRGRF